MKRENHQLYTAQLPQLQGAKIVLVLDLIPTFSVRAPGSAGTRRLPKHLQAAKSSLFSLPSVQQPCCQEPGTSTGHKARKRPGDVHKCNTNQTFTTNSGRSQCVFYIWGNDLAHFGVASHPNFSHAHVDSLSPSGCTCSLVAWLCDGNELSDCIFSIWHTGDTSHALNTSQDLFSWMSLHGTAWFVLRQWNTSSATTEGGK